MENPGSEPPRCPCGFWGSPQTLNLCSKCFKDEQKRKSQNQSSSCSAIATSSIDRVPVTIGESSCEEASKLKDKTPVENDEGTRNQKCVEETCPASSESISESTTETTRNDQEDVPQQKNKKRCWKCKAKLELAQRELGICKCGYVFCQLHRLPEQHECIFDHKESGRKEAREKMVTLGPRKVGRSFQRIDDC